MFIVFEIIQFSPPLPNPLSRKDKIWAIIFWEHPSLHKLFSKEALYFLLLLKLKIYIIVRRVIEKFIRPSSFEKIQATQPRIYDIILVIEP